MPKKTIQEETFLLEVTVAVKNPETSDDLLDHVNDVLRDGLIKHSKASKGHLVKFSAKVYQEPKLDWGVDLERDFK